MLLLQFVGLLMLMFIYSCYHYSLHCYV